MLYIEHGNALIEITAAVESPVLQLFLESLYEEFKNYVQP